MQPMRLRCSSALRADARYQPMSARLLTVAVVGIVLSTVRTQNYQRPGCALRCRETYECVRYNQICDGRADCPSGEDEICNYSTLSPMELPACIISESQFCDGFKDCLDGSDEAKCSSTTTPPLVNLGTDWLWTWPLVGAVLCALVCTAVALSLRYMHFKRQQRREARRRAAAEALAAETGILAGSEGGIRRPPFSLPSYAEATGAPFASGCPNMGFCVGPADLPPDYQEAIREAERQSALEKQLLRRQDGSSPLPLLPPQPHASAMEEVDSQLLVPATMTCHGSSQPSARWPPAEHGNAALPDVKSYRHYQLSSGCASSIAAADRAPAVAVAAAPGSRETSTAATSPLPDRASTSASGMGNIPAPAYEAVFASSDGVHFGPGLQVQTGGGVGFSGGEDSRTRHTLC